MLRGLIRGATTAAGVAAIVLSSVSLLAPTRGDAPRPAEAPRSVPPAQPEMAATERSAPTRPEALPERALPAEQETARLPVPQLDTPAAPVTRPEPSETAAAPDLVPVLPVEETAAAPEARTPAVPAGEERTVALAIPAGSQFNRPREDVQPIAPDAEEAARGFAAPTSRPAEMSPLAAPAPDTSSGSVPDAGLAVTGVAVPEAGLAPMRPATLDEIVPRAMLDATQPGDRPGSAAEPAAEVETDPVRPSAPAPVEAAAEPEAPVEVAEPEARRELAQAEPEEPSTAPVVLERLSAPAPAVPGLAPTVPTLSDAATTEIAALAEPPARIMPRRIVLDSDRREAGSPGAAEETAEARADQTRALTAHAAAFENPRALPLLSIVLIDDPQGGLSRESLMAVDLPLTFAVDPARPDAAEVAAAYRAAGHEVLLQGEGLPVAGTGSEIAAALRAAREAVPVAVGVLDGRGGGFARDRRALSALAEPLGEAGMGFVGFDLGLGAGFAAAEAAGVPAEPVYRIVDENGERATVIARYLDRATFEAAERGSTIVVGRTTPDMLTALLSWASGRRADTVALAPVSRILRGGDGGA